MKFSLFVVARYCCGLAFVIPSLPGSVVDIFLHTNRVVPILLNNVFHLQWPNCEEYSAVFFTMLVHGARKH